MWIFMNANSAISNFFEAAERLDKRSLDAVIDQILTLRIRREYHGISADEVQLIQKINKGLPKQMMLRFNELSAKQLEAGIDDSELNELSVLLEKIEKMNVKRLQYITALATIRKISVREVMQQLGIVPTIDQIQ